MAIGIGTDFKIYQDQLNGGYVETLVQNTNVFNAAVNNAIRMIVARSRGNWQSESFFKNIADLITRRDITSVAPATPKKLEQGEYVSVKLNRKIGPVDQTLDSFKKIGRGAKEQQELSFLLGTQVAKGVVVKQLNDAIASVRAALATQATNTHVVATNGTLSTSAGLVDALAKMGDGADRIVVWVMHSKAFYDLVKEQIALNIVGVSGFNVANASPVTLNRPVIVTDAAALIEVDGGGAGVNDYFALGLTENAVTIEDSEEETIVAEFVTGLENLVVRLQGEFAYNLGMKGFTWDLTNGGINPVDAALATGTNWDKVLASHKDLPGILIQTR